MAITTIDACPNDIQNLWRAAEFIGFSDFIYMAKENVLMGSPFTEKPQLEDDRVPITWDMSEFDEANRDLLFIPRKGMLSILAQLHYCEYENEAGYLENNVAFQRLVELTAARPATPPATRGLQPAGQAAPSDPPASKLTRWLVD